MTNVPHGTTSRYTNQACRCDPCIQAQRKHQRSYRLRLRVSEPPSHVHGTTNGYQNYGCRCEECGEAQRIKGRERRARKRGGAK